VSENHSNQNANGANDAADKSTPNTTQNVGDGANANNEVTELKALAEKYKNDFLYLRAEFDNYKRHAIKERAELTKYGSERLVVELLNVLDNFERALEIKISADNFESFKKGVEMTATELKGMLTRFGVAELPCQGVAFDPMVHEALSAEETTNVPEGHISRVFKKPYKFHDKVVRPGQVVVAKAPTMN
jgi:molecular chaperone GrpE